MDRVDLQHQLDLENLLDLLRLMDLENLVDPVHLVDPEFLVDHVDLYHQLVLADLDHPVVPADLCLLMDLVDL